MSWQRRSINNYFSIYIGTVFGGLAAGWKRDVTYVYILLYVCYVPYMNVCYCTVYVCFCIYVCVREKECTVEPVC